LPGAIKRALLDGTEMIVPPREERIEIMRAHYDEMIAYHGAHHGVRIVRKHLGWYATDLGLGPEFRARVMQEDDPRAVARALGEIGATNLLPMAA
jgi:tRNA-dihydrouridine synthase B